MDLRTSSILNIPRIWRISSAVSRSSYRRFLADRVTSANATLPSDVSKVSDRLLSNDAKGEQSSIISAAVAGAGDSAGSDVPTMGRGPISAKRVLRLVERDSPIGFRHLARAFNSWPSLVMSASSTTTPLPSMISPLARLMNSLVALRSGNHKAPVHLVPNAVTEYLNFHGYLPKVIGGHYVADRRVLSHRSCC